MEEALLILLVFLFIVFSVGEPSLWDRLMVLLDLHIEEMQLSKHHADQRQ